MVLHDTLSASYCRCVLHSTSALSVVHAIARGLDLHDVNASHLGFVGCHV